MAQVYVKNVLHADSWLDIIYSLHLSEWSLFSQKLKSAAYSELF